MKFKSHFLAALCGLALAAGFAGHSQAAAVTWNVSASFNDGGTLTGYIATNVYGYISSFDVVTSSGSSFSGANYTPPNTTPGAFAKNTFDYSIANYQNGKPLDLVLTFASSLGTASASNILTSGYECAGSWSCGAASNTRATVSGSAVAVPGPIAGTGPLALLGAAGVFLAMRRRSSARRSD